MSGSARHPYVSINDGARRFVQYLNRFGRPEMGNIMFEIDKQKFGAFVAMLRKEKGLTQKEMAKILYISDKAVSKWETGVSIPDTPLLIPLAELLGVTVTELLMSRRMEQDKPMDTELVESVVQRAISYSDDKPARVYHTKSPWIRTYILAFLISCVEILLSILTGHFSIGLPLVVFLGMLFGGYFCIFAIVRLPDYYDENPVHIYNDNGFFNMSFPGLTFNNRNWLPILNACRIWALAAMVVYPVISFVLALLFPGRWMTEFAVEMLFIFGGMFVPIYITGKKFE